ncbi:MAG: PDZ domain-containing protein [Proteobacteria bacterium]|nr:PDZ domain-containing protein [Pseudomonadota bacterium]
MTSLLHRGARFLTAALVLTLLPLGPLLADDKPVRGDLPPVALDPSRMLGDTLDGRQAEALANEVHALLLKRLGSDQISDAELWMGAIQGMIDVVNRRQAVGASRTQAALPPSGMLLSEDDADELGDAFKGELTGVGIEFQLYSRPGVMVVSRILPGSPAELAGLLPGDRIIALDGAGLAGASLQDVLGMLGGDEGTRIAVQFQRGEGLAAASFAVGVQRGTFAVRSVLSELRSGGVGYIRVFGFHQETPREVAESLTELGALGADRYVLDLRNNVGGDLSGAIGVADLFLPIDTVLGRIVEPGVGELDLVATQPPMTEDNLVVLVNAWTHGAAEAVAVALQEHHRAYIIGEPTMGSARTETLVSLGHSLVLRISSVRLQSPTGQSWEGHGVQPDQEFATAGGYDGGALDEAFNVAARYLETEGL